MNLFLGFCVLLKILGTSHAFIRYFLDGVRAFYFIFLVH